MKHSVSTMSKHVALSFLSFFFGSVSAAISVNAFRVAATFGSPPTIFAASFISSFFSSTAGSGSFAGAIFAAPALNSSRSIEPSWFVSSACMSSSAVTLPSLFRSIASNFASDSEALLSPPISSMSSMSCIVVSSSRDSAPGLRSRCRLGRAWARPIEPGCTTLTAALSRNWTGIVGVGVVTASEPSAAPAESAPGGAPPSSPELKPPSIWSMSAS